MSYQEPSGLGEPSSDIGALWRDAYVAYYKITEKDLLKLPRFNTVNDILRDSQLSADTFNSYRHNGKSVDRLRSLLSKHSDLVESAAKQITSAASASFPPSAAIMTAISFMLKASKDVSADYDKIISFFDVLNSFLERISILESKLPGIRAYQVILTRVFTSLLTISAIATDYIAKKRFRKWFEAMLKGSDDKLKGAYDTLEENIRRLESASLLATLANTESLKLDMRGISFDIRETLTVVKETHVDVKAIHLDTQENLTLTREMAIAQQQQATSQQQFQAALVQKLDVLGKLTDHFEKPQQKEKQADGPKQPTPGGKLKDNASKKAVALRKVRDRFRNDADPIGQGMDIEFAFVKGTSSWIFENESYRSWIGGSSPFLWIHGPPGIGKSFLAFEVARRLAEGVPPHERRSVAYFYFRDEHADLRSVRNAVFWTVQQIAQHDSQYCEQVAADIDTNEAGFGDDEIPVVWDRYIAKRFSNKLEAKPSLYLIFDGLDEADAHGRNKLLGLLAQIGDANIHVLITSRQEIRDEIEPLKPQKIEVTKGHISEDLKRLIKFQCGKLSRLRKFRRETKRKIVLKITKQADSMLYADHMLRRLNSIGREGAVLKELEKHLPGSLSALYALMLSDCQKHRTPEQFHTLKKLFAWLAYSRRPLTLGEAAELVEITAHGEPFSIEEELSGKSARILEIATEPLGNTEELAEQTETEPEDDIEAGTGGPDDSPPLRFQERSMREYFRQMEVDDFGLRTSPSSAHLTIFEMCIQLICANKEDKEKETASGLRDYATNFWAYHFLDINHVAVSDEEVIRIVNCLKRILKNEAEAAADTLERYSDSTVDVFQLSSDAQPNFLHAMHTCVARAAQVCSSWAQVVVESSDKALLPVAHAHAENMMKQLTGFEANRRYQLARNTLVLAGTLSKPTDENPEDSPEQIRAVFDAFSDMQKDASALRALGNILNYYGHYKDAAAELTRSLEKCSDDISRFYTLATLARVYRNSATFENEPVSENGKEENKDYLQRDGEDLAAGKSKWQITYDTILAALKLQPQQSPEQQEINDQVLRLMPTLLLQKAESEEKLDMPRAALKSYEEIRLVNPEWTLGGDSLNTMTKIVCEDDNYSGMITMVQSWNVTERVSWLVWWAEENLDADERFQKAAKACGKEDFMVEVYQELIEYMDQFGRAASPRRQLAQVYQRLLGDSAKAKVILYDLLNSDSFINASTGEEDIYMKFETRFNLADIIFEEFRATSDLMLKASLLQEMKNLAARPLNTGIGPVVNPFESQMAVTLAIMIRKMGPAAEYQDILDKAFHTCVEGLSDSVGWNDQPSFRLLAKVLACVPGLERDAQLAITLQFSLLDAPPLVVKASSSTGEMDHTVPNGNPTDDTATGAPELNAAADILPAEEDRMNGAQITAEHAGPTTNGTDADGLPEPDNAPDDESQATQREQYQMDTNLTIGCDGCGQCIDTWPSDGTPFYNCLICCNSDLCEPCYQKLLSYSRAETSSEWKTYCGLNHRYVKGPIDGWHGVKGDIMMIGEEKLGVQTWLEELKERWKESCGQWWRDDGVVDIF